MRKYTDNEILLLMEFDMEKYEAMLREEGKIRTLSSLVSKRVITVEQALDESNLSRDEFLQEMNSFIKKGKSAFYIITFTAEIEEDKSPYNSQFISWFNTVSVE